jgi:hypothetical protein
VNFLKGEKDVIQVKRWNEAPTEIRLARCSSMVYSRPMTFTQRIPADRLSGLDIHAGDTLHVIALHSSAFVVQVNRADAAAPSRGKASEWLRSAKGSVRLNANETVDDARMDYYATKYGLTR